MSNHTLRPWAVCGNNPDYVIDASNEFVCQVLGRDQDEIDEKKRLIAATPDADELLKEMEWARGGIVDAAECPSCWGYIIKGHKPDCKLAAYFRKVDGNE